MGSRSPSSPIGDQLLEYFGLSEATHRRIGEYSKGMRQKLALARAMIHDPGVLLLDEPTSAMDPESARLVRDEIARLKSSRRTIVICSHNLTEVEALADKIAVIYRGKILIQGSLEELKVHALGEPRYELLFSRDWDSSGMKIPAGVRVVSRSPRQILLQVSHPQEVNSAILKELASRSAPVLAFQPESRSLEQVYLKVMSNAREYTNVH
ncbi:MAG: ABC transporter ATP-binding protein [Chloroflexi bacterium]|nr:ABC transporter ATP-binding protein [Chloroflexota bacterium]